MGWGAVAGCVVESNERTPFYSRIMNPFFIFLLKWHKYSGQFQDLLLHTKEAVTLDCEVGRPDLEGARLHPSVVGPELYRAFDPGIGVVEILCPVRPVVPEVGHCQGHGLPQLKTVGHSAEDGRFIDERGRDDLGRDAGFGVD